MREIACALCRRRNTRGGKVAGAVLAIPFVIQKEEALVMTIVNFGQPYGSAYRAAEDIVMKHSFWSAIQITEVVVGVKQLVFDELIGRTVKLVAAAASNDGDHTTRQPSVFGRKAAADDLELLHRLG